DEWHIGTFGRGALVGEMGFLDSRRRSADVLAVTEVHCFVLSRQRFDALASENSQAAAQIFSGIAVVLAQRIRLLNKELRIQRS
ncbi:MAG: cyclic nucleotide-binding domain-containing protein, partial [Candidatus Accumulibacter sp.]|uniref:cyclic nucleotide-binding domain-containing protein n=1 Tax=Accumulibacter sp. TaxID=2053492 RepID=UPI002878A0A4